MTKDRRNPNDERNLFRHALSPARAVESAMFAMPVIERELRVRTWTRITHWQRSLVAALAGLACFFSARASSADCAGWPGHSCAIGICANFGVRSFPTPVRPAGLVDDLHDWLGRDVLRKSRADAISGA